ncbi:MAG: protein kinase [Proteobacteria bacterium]|nr:protein kinase [Pseudomonadota bacterium]
MQPSPPAADPPDDDERTRVVPASGSLAALPAGTMLQEFVIREVVGEGGFSIVYLATDTRLQRDVALKEYMPANFAARGSRREVLARSMSHRDVFELGLRGFLVEAQMLAAFNHPALARVHRIWEENGTAYIVMPLYRGCTLKQWLADHAAPPDEAWLRALVARLAEALELMHRDRVYHRDIAPDNIMLLESDEALPAPLLLDFGAARRAVADADQSFTVILKPGYAPLEQTEAAAGLQQGPWTDVYALCAVLYRAVTGRVPPSAVQRLAADRLEPVARHARASYTPALLAAIDAGLALRPVDRIASMPDLLRAIGPFDPTSGTGHALPREPRARRRLVLSVLTAALAAAVPTTWWLTRGLRTAPVAAPPSPMTPAAPVVVAATAPASASMPASGSASEPASMAARADVPQEPLTIAPEPLPASPQAALDRLVAGADPGIAVTLSTRSATVVTGQDHIDLRVRSSVAGHVYVYFLDTDGQLLLLSPLSGQEALQLVADQEVDLTPPGLEVTPLGRDGENRIVAIVAPEARRFGKALSSAPKRKPRQVDVLRAGAAGGLAGEPACAPAMPCDARYGAASVRVRQTRG